MRGDKKRLGGARASAPLLITILLALAGTALAAGPDTAWLRKWYTADTTHAVNFWNQAAAIAVDAANDRVFVAGSGRESLNIGSTVQDMFIWLYRTDGTLVDVAWYGGWPPSGQDPYWAQKILLTGNTVYLVGHTWNGAGTPPRYDDASWCKFWVVQDHLGRDSALQSVWANKSAASYDDRFYDAELSADGSLYACGFRDSSDAQWDGPAACLMKIDTLTSLPVWRVGFVLDRQADGKARKNGGRDAHPALFSPLISEDWDIGGNNYAAMSIAPNGNILLAGYALHRNFENEFMVHCRNSSGALLWGSVGHHDQAASNDEEDAAFDIVTTTTHAFATGFMYRNDAVGTQPAVRRYALSSGTYSHFDITDGSGDYDGYGVALALDDSSPRNVYVTGFSGSAADDGQVFVQKFDSLFNARWGSTGAVLNLTADDDEGYSVAYAQGRVYVGGNRADGGAFVAAFSADNTLPKETLWTHVYDPVGDNFTAVVAAVDSNNIYFAGQEPRRVGGVQWGTSMFVSRLFYPWRDVAAVRLEGLADTVRLGDSLAPAVWVKNLGTVAATFRDSIAIGGWRDTAGSAGLAPGDSVRHQFGWWTASALGTQAARCTVMMERDTVPANNRLVQNVFVAWRDVACSLIVAPAGTVDSGTLVTPRAWMANLGNVPASFDARLRIAGLYSNTQPVSLTPGQRQLVSFAPVTLVARGTFAVACSTFLAPDWEAANNTQHGSVTVRVTDLRVLSIAPAAETVLHSDTVRPWLRLVNAGSEAVQSRAHFRLTRPDNVVAFADSTAVLTLGPGADSTVAFGTVVTVARTGFWQARAWCGAAGDQHRPNDTLGRSFFVTAPGGIAWEPGWHEASVLPVGSQQKMVKDGGALAVLNLGPRPVVYALKGNKTAEFYSYEFTPDLWEELAPVPSGPDGKLPYRGARLCTDDQGAVYALKGNNTLEFWRYTLADSTWTAAENVPAGEGKKVKGGSDMVHVDRGAGRNYLYLLKGYRNEFYRFNLASGAWESLDPAPVGVNPKWDKGSFLVYDGAGSIYAHKAKYHELWRYDVDGDSWDFGDTLAGMPYYGMMGRRKKAKDGSSGAWFEDGFYAFKGGNTQEFWHYNALTDTWAEKETIPAWGAARRKKRVKGGGDLVYNAYAIWGLKGNKTQEFWRYGIPFGLDATRAGRSGVQAAAGAAVTRREFAILPNPMTGAGELRYALPEPAALTVRVYDALGRQAAVPVQRRPLSGRGSLRLDLGGLPAGTYLVRIESTGGPAETRKLVVE